MVMDYLTSQKVASIRKTIEANLRYLSSCSPDFNPIEQFFTRALVANRE